MATETKTEAVSRPRRRLGTGISKDDLRVYESIPERIDYMPHPDFRLAATGDRLFGPDSEPVHVPPWRPFPEVGQGEVSPPKARSFLSRDQETLLFMRYNYARYRLAKVMAAQKRRFARSRAAEAVSWYRQALDVQAGLANANMALVVAMARRTRINTIEFGELVSEGNMALLRAIEKFDISRGFKFSTYACRAILKSFSRLATKAGRYRQYFPTEFDPDMEQSDEIERRHLAQRELAIEDLQRVLLHNAASLTDVERKVVRARFAVDGARAAQTLEQVGRVVGLSKERVRQVQNDALTKLRVALDERAA